MFLHFFHRISWFFIGFSNVSELLVRKHWKTNTNHEFFIFLYHSLKIMLFLVFIGCANVFELLVMVFSWFLVVFPMFLSFWLRKHWKTNKNHEFFSFLYHSLKIMFFLVFIGCANVFELLVVMVFSWFFWFYQCF